MVKRVKRKRLKRRRIQQALAGARRKRRRGDKQRDKIGPTPEFQMKRALLAGDGDPKLCTDALGVLVARGAIDRQSRDAGFVYGVLYRATNGYPFPRGVSVEVRGQNFVVSDERRASMELDYKAAKTSLLKKGRKIADLVERVSVFDDKGVALDSRNYSLVADGLNELGRHFKLK